MKKTLLALMIFGLPGTMLFAQTKITNNPILVINAGNSVTCNAGGIITAENNFFHLYDLANYSNVTDTAFFVRMFVGAEESSGGAYNIVGRVHQLTGAPMLANMTLLTDDTAAIYPDSTLFLMNIMLNDGAYALPGDLLVGELVLPATTTASFYPASNTSPESSPTYIVATGCSINELTTVASLGFPDMHLIMNLYVNQKPQMSGMSSTMFKDAELAYAAADFTSQFNDNDNDGLTMVKVATLPSNGDLDLGGVTLVLGDTIMTSELDMLKYIPNTGYAGSDNFELRAADSSHWANTPAAYDITVYDWQASVEENQSSTITLYPNPASGYVTIQANEKIEQVRVFDGTGKMVLDRRSADKQVDLSPFENGVYFIEVRTGGGFYMEQVVKQ
jgi:hypothetical protein